MCDQWMHRAFRSAPRFLRRGSWPARTYVAVLTGAIFAGWASSSHGQVATAPARERGGEPALVDGATGASESPVRIRAKLIETKVEPTFVRERLMIEREDGQVIPALLCLPRNGEQGRRFPVVVLIHGAYEDRKETMVYRYAARLAAAGLASIAYDLPGHGERAKQDDGGFHTSLGLLLLDMAMERGGPVPPGLLKSSVGAAITPSMSPILRGVAGSVTDGQRVIDYLQTRPEIDPDHIAANGVSLGGTLAVMLAGRDERICAVVANVAGAWAEVRNRIAGDPDLERIWATLDPAVTGPLIAPRPVLMLNGRKDVICVTANAEALYAHLGRQKMLKWYDAGHGLPKQAADDAAVWLSDKLGRPAAPAKSPAAATR